MGVRLIQHLYRLAVEEHVIAVREERVGRHCRGRRGRLTAFAPGHPQLRILVRDDLRSVRRLGSSLRREVAGDDRPTGFRDGDISADVVGVCVRVDDVTDRLVAGKTPDLGEDLLAHGFGAGVHDEDAIRADLGGNVHEAGVDQPDVALHETRAHVSRRRRGRTRRTAATRLRARIARHDDQAEDDERDDTPAHFFTSFFANSGSAVSAPPRVASIGRLCFLAKSPMKGF